MANKKVDKERIQKARKELKEAEDAVYDAAESADGEAKQSLTRAVVALEKAGSEIDEAEE